jgi:hypothetical protein
MWSAAPLVRAGLLAVADGAPLTLPARPAAITAHPVCRLSGLAPGAGCPTTLERFAPGTEPRTPCTWHRVERGRVTVALPPELARWARDHRAADLPGDPR